MNELFYTELLHGIIGLVLMNITWELLIKNYFATPFDKDYEKRNKDTYLIERMIYQLFLIIVLKYIFG